MPLRPSAHRLALRRCDGQATVEFVAVLPFVVVAGLLAWQLALTGHTAWLAAHAARAGARADAVGLGVEKAARSAVPDAFERDLEARRLPEGGVRVSVRVPLFLRRWSSPVSISATSSLGRGK